MRYKQAIESPMVQLLSFNKLLNHYEEQLKSKDKWLAARAKYVLDTQAPYPELRNGFDDLSILEERKEVIEIILADTFSSILTENEIKTASLPYENVAFNSSRRFQEILENAGEGFQLEMETMKYDMHYIVQCTVILGFYYGYQLDFKRPFFYNIPDKNGVIRHYRILYNVDFMEINPIGNAKELTQDDVDELLEDFQNIDLWKSKIPPSSFELKGFAICNMFDVTAEQSISEIKTTLIGRNKSSDENFMESFQNTFRSLFNLKGIQVGFAGYDTNTDSFLKIHGRGIKSFLLKEKSKESCGTILCEYSYTRLLKESTFFSIPNIEKYYNKFEGKTQPYKGLHIQGFKSAILAPIAHEGTLLGVLELVSNNLYELNSVNANKLIDVMPYIVSAVLRSRKEEENLIDAIIQHECTTIHSSVYWKFQEEAKQFMTAELQGKHPIFKEIVFKDIYPLYGQIDIKNSSKERNLSIQRDLTIQLSLIDTILKAAWKKFKLPIYEELEYRVNSYLEEIKGTLYTNSEQAIYNFVQEEINPVFHHLKREDQELVDFIIKYENNIDTETESYYDHRRNYDESVMSINKKLAAVIDTKQAEAQEMFPHYFERYKTDGVEHNMYIGSEIANDRNFDSLYLNNLRLWQLQVMVEMEITHYELKPNLPISLDVASLILVYSTPLAIRFRMDEKQFDVDGTYNARYEVIKKRIDKSYIKGTNERLTQKGKLAIVYSLKKDEKEYLRYIKFLKAKGYFTNNIEILELEDLEGVIGLKAIRVEVLYKTANLKPNKTYTYNDLVEEFKI